MLSRKNRKLQRKRIRCDADLYPELNRIGNGSFVSWRIGLMDDPFLFLALTPISVQHLVRQRILQHS